MDPASTTTPTSTPTSTVIVLTTMPADPGEGKLDAIALGRTLVEEGLAACVNVLPPMESVYRWQGSVHQDAERQLVIKTRAELSLIHISEPTRPY